MNVMLDPHFQHYVKDKVESGEYASEDEVILEALRRMEDEERTDDTEALRAAIAVALEQEARGEVEEWTPELQARLRRESIENAFSDKPIRDDVKY